VADVLAHPDMADFGIEDLRKWRRWEYADRVLGLFGKESHDAPVMRRAILRFALRCPGERAAALVRQQRRLDPTLVTDVEEILRLEDDTPALPAKGK
jgi:hypothetical protein